MVASYSNSLADWMPLTEAAAKLPIVRGKKTPHPKTLARWSRVGLLSASGERIRLDVKYVGSVPCTSLRALEEFFDRRQHTAPLTIPSTISRREQEQLEAHNAEVMERLRRKGIVK